MSIDKDKLTASAMRFMGIKQAEPVATKPLTEERQTTDAPAAATASTEPAATKQDDPIVLPESRFKTSAEVVDALMEMVDAAYASDVILSEQAVEDKDRNAVKANITEKVAQAVASGASLDEAFKLIRRLVGGSLKKVKQRILKGAEKMKAKLLRRRHRSDRKRYAKVYRRKASTKRHMKKVAKLRAKLHLKKAAAPAPKNESVAALRALLNESAAPATTPVDPLDFALFEAAGTLNLAIAECADKIQAIIETSNLSELQGHGQIAESLVAGCDKTLEESVLGEWNKAAHLAPILNRLSVLQALAKEIDTVVPLRPAFLAAVELPEGN
jgi:hypothetical protein